MAGLVSGLQQRLNSEKDIEIPSFELYGIDSNSKVFDRTVAFHISQIGNDSKEIDVIKALRASNYLENLDLCQRVGPQVHLTMKTTESKQNLMKKGIKFKNSYIIFQDPAVRVKCNNDEELHHKETI